MNGVPYRLYQDAAAMGMYWDIYAYSLPFQLRFPFANLLVDPVRTRFQRDLCADYLLRRNNADTTTNRTPVSIGLSRFLALRARLTRTGPWLTRQGSQFPWLYASLSASYAGGCPNGRTSHSMPRSFFEVTMQPVVGKDLVEVVDMMAFIKIP